MFEIGPGIAALGASFITGGVALWAAILVARIKISAEHSHRIWESRKQSYTSILAKLKDASVSADLVDRGYNSGEGGFGSEDYFVSPAREKHEVAASKAWARCQSEFDVNRLILSDGFSSRFESLRQSLPTEYDEYSPPRDAALRAGFLRDAYRDLLPLARHEMLSPEARGGARQILSAFRGLPRPKLRGSGG